MESGTRLEGRNGGATGSPEAFRVGTAAGWIPWTRPSRDTDHAFECLERAFQTRSAGLIYLHIDPGYKPLRDDPRFANLVSRIGLR